MKKFIIFIIIILNRIKIFKIMSTKGTFISNVKSLKDKKNIIFVKKSNKKELKFKIMPKFENQYQLYSLIHENLKTYSTSKKKYDKFIINTIIFDQRIHKVAVFKNNLLWDESSEFLKRFYKKKESKQRIPKISEYYERYTLFSPVYFGLEGLLVIIMNRWTKRKKNYLEYIEDHEDDKKIVKKKDSFEPLINQSSLDNITISKSLTSKNTLELTKFENNSKKNLLNKKKQVKNNHSLNKEQVESISFLHIIDDLSSNYSIIINPDNKENIKRKINKKEEKSKTINFNENDKSKNIKYNNNKTNKTNINNISKTLKDKNIEISKKNVKICLDKKNNMLTLKNNDSKIVFRNDKHIEIPSTKKYLKKILIINNLEKIGFPSKSINKGTIKVNPLSNYSSEMNKKGNINNILQSTEKEHSALKKSNKDINKNLKFKKGVQPMNTINNGTFLNSVENKQNRLIKNKNLILQKKNFIHKRKYPFLSINNSYNSLNKLKQTTFINPTITSDSNCFLERVKNEKTSKNNLISNTPKINMEIIDPKKIKDIINNHKNLYLEDPFAYKLSKINKKKMTSLTSTHSLIKNKNTNIHSIIKNNMTTNFYNSKNKIKTINKKNLVLNKLNNKNNLIYNKKRKVLGDNSTRNHSSNSNSILKSSDSHLNFNTYNKKINNWKNISKNQKAKNINLNLNLNIHFNIGVENRNKRRKILFNNTIINQLKNKTNKISKMSNTNTNRSNDKEFIHKYPLTSRTNNSIIRGWIE